MEFIIECFMFSIKILAFMAIFSVTTFLIALIVCGLCAVLVHLFDDGDETDEEDIWYE
jgi:hypothetical protein